MEDDRENRIPLPYAWTDDPSISRLLAKLDDDEMELIGDSLIAAINGGCDEFFHRLFEVLIPERIVCDKSGKWNAVQAMLDRLYGESAVSPGQPSWHPSSWFI